MRPAKRGRGEDRILASIDVGTNAVRLELARPAPDGALETLHQERDPVRPGEGVFTTGAVPREVADRLIATLRRYAALSRRYGATVRAVATSAVREARNRDEIVRRVHREAGIDLEVVSGREEARLICLGVLHGRPEGVRSLVIDIGGGSTEIADARGERPTDLWSVAVGGVRLTELFGSSGRVNAAKLSLLRSYAAEAFSEELPPHRAFPRTALGSSGTINAVVGFGAAGTAHATRKQVARAVEELAEMTPARRRQRFDPKRAEIVVAGAVILEAAMEALRLDAVIAVQRGLRDGILVDLLHRSGGVEDRSVVEAAVAFGRRLGFDEPHALQVSRLALALFDGLAAVHRLPASARSLLEVAALLHDVGHAVSYQKHHKHSFYLIANADIAGLADRERDMVARVARFHRRSPPARDHADLEPLSAAQREVVRKLATLLRLADGLDRSHHQPVRGLRIRAGRDISIAALARGSVDLEIWDASRELPLFREVFRRRVELRAR